MRGWEAAATGVLGDTQEHAEDAGAGLVGNTADELVVEISASAVQKGWSIRGDAMGVKGQHMGGGRAFRNFRAKRPWPASLRRWNQPGVLVAPPFVQLSTDRGQESSLVRRLTKCAVHHLQSEPFRGIDGKSARAKVRGDLRTWMRRGH